jgi:hypothetical protein
MKYLPNFSGTCVVGSPWGYGVDETGYIIFIKLANKASFSNNLEIFCETYYFSTRTIMPFF